MLRQRQTIKQKYVMCKSVQISLYFDLKCK